MRHLIALIALGTGLLSPVSAQFFGSSTAKRTQVVASLPGTCSTGDIVYKTGASAGFYTCESNVWTLPGSEPAYPATFTATASVSVAQTTHLQGARPVVEVCYDNATPRVALAFSYTAAANGDVVITLTGGVATGECLISAGKSGKGATGATGAAGNGYTNSDGTATEGIYMRELAANGTGWTGIEGEAAANANDHNVWQFGGTLPTSGKFVALCSAASTGQTRVVFGATVADANVTACAPAAIPSCSDATNSKLLFNAATGVFSCGTDQSGAGGTINSGAGLGYKFVFPQAGYEGTATTTASGGSANRGFIIQHLNAAQTEWRKVKFKTGSVTDNGKGFKICVWNAARTSLLAESTVYLFPASTAQFGEVTWASGSAVSGGVFTEPSGVTWWGITSDSTTGTIHSMSGPPAVTVANLQTESKAFWPSGALSSGTLGSLACVANVSALTAAGVTNLYQIVATN